MLLASWGLAAACGRPATGLMLVVDTDMPQGPGATLSAVRVRVFSQESDETAISDTTRSLGGADGLLPRSLAIEPRGRDASRRVRVRVTALGASGDLFETEAAAGFVEGRVNVLRVFLADRCRDPANRSCPAGQTCGRDACEPVARVDLPRFDPDSGPPDAAVPADVPVVDAVAEASLDAPADVPADAPVVDAVADAPADVPGDSPRDAPIDVALDARDAEAPPDVPGLDVRDAPDASVADALDAPADAPRPDGSVCACETGTCTALLFDDHNCGRCGAVCPAGQWCSVGRCVDRCTGSNSYCSEDNNCFDTQFDSTHCGSCSRACGTGIPCEAGACRTVGPNGVCQNPIDIGALSQGQRTVLVKATNNPSGRPRCAGTPFGSYVSFSLPTRSLVLVEGFTSPGDTANPNAVLGYVGTACPPGDLLMTGESCQAPLCGPTSSGLFRVLAATTGAGRHIVSVDSAGAMVPNRVNVHALTLPAGATPTQLTLGSPSTLPFADFADAGCGNPSGRYPASFVYFAQCPTEERGVAYDVRFSNCGSGSGRFYTQLTTSRGNVCAGFVPCSGPECTIAASACASQSRRFYLPRGTRGPAMLSVVYLPSATEPAPAGVQITVTPVE